MDFKEVYPDTCSTTALAARYNNVDALQNLIRLGKSVDVKDNRGWISLHEAASNGHVECVKIILHQDAELVHFRTFEEETPLLLACRGSHPECVRLLLESGADPNKVTNEGYSPLWEAASNMCMESVNLLINAGADINRQVFTGDTPLHMASQKDYREILATLLEAGADIAVKTENEITPLFVAAQFGKFECLKLLIEAAASKGEAFKVDYINTPAYDKATPLFLAAQEGHANTVDLLLKHGADPHLYVQIDPNPKQYLYPLQVAVSKNNVRCVELLLGVTDIKRFDWAIFKSQHKLFGDLERPPSVFLQPLFMAMENEDGDCLKLLISHGYLQQYQRQVHDKTIGNIFQAVPLKFKTVVIFVKCCEAWVRSQFETRNWDIYSTALFEDSYMGRIGTLVILLWMGAPCEGLIYRRAITTNPEQLLLLFKYIKSKNLCKDCSLAQRKICIENLETLGLSDWDIITQTLIMKLCLTPNFIKFTSKLTDLLSHKETSDSWPDPADLETPKVTAKTTRIAHYCRDSFNTLQHMCRVHIVFHLLHANNYTREATLSLGLPVMLQKYLLYNDVGEPGKMLVKAAAQVHDIEGSVRQVYEETDVSDIAEK